MPFICISPLFPILYRKWSTHTHTAREMANGVEHYIYLIRRIASPLNFSSIHRIACMYFRFLFCLVIQHSLAQSFAFFCYIDRFCYCRCVRYIATSCTFPLILHHIRVKFAMRPDHQGTNAGDTYCVILPSFGLMLYFLCARNYMYTCECECVCVCSCVCIEAVISELHAQVLYLLISNKRIKNKICARLPWQEMRKRNGCYIYHYLLINRIRIWCGCLLYI